MSTDVINIYNETDIIKAQSQSNLSINSKQGVNLTVGDASISIDENGKVSIVCKELELKGSETINIEGGNISIKGKTTFKGAVEISESLTVG